MTQSTAWDRDTFLELTEFREVEEVLRRGRDFVLHGTKAGSDEFVHGTIVAIDGRPHLNRRRALNRMISAEQPWGPEGTLVDEIFGRQLGRIRANTPPQDGLIGFDLVELGRRVVWRVTAAFVGIDDVDDEARAERFMELALPVLEGLTLEYHPTQEHPALIAAARAASARMREEMFDPSLERRRTAVAAARAGEGSLDDLPADLLTSLLVAAGDGEPDIETMFREMIALLSASVNNPVSQIAWALDDLLPWLAEHPEHEADLADKEFLNRAVKETLRMHRSSRPHVVRIAATDTVLESSGRRIPQGQWVSCWLQAANHDQEIFGPTADVYDPFRTPLDPSVAPFGMAFGAGPHVCLGRPLLLWDQGGPHAQGLQIKVLRFLLGAGVRRDPDGVQNEGGPQGGRRFTRYDVVMPA